MTRRNIRLAVDIGGTFTDLIAIDDSTGQIIDRKVPTTPKNYADGVLTAIAGSGIDPAAIAQLVHGTTVVINTITQRTGARVALVTTRGFRDALAIGRGNRPDMYNLRFHKPEPFVPRRFRFEVAERVLFDGTIESELDVAALDDIARTCIEEEIEAIAICFLHSYAHPGHEKRARDYLETLLPGVPITISSDITKEWREYERTSTAVLNAYVDPVTSLYLDRLDSRFDAQAVTSNRFAMTSNGGVSTFPFAREQPIQLVESGPVGGIIGAQVMGSAIGMPNLITLDIGGTTAKCSIIVDGEFEISGDYRLEHSPFSPGYPVKVPVVDIVEIGAGGGSLIWFDAGGGLRIGPRSAGADPGPACYGLGGTEPTITDAMVVAGVIPEGPLPGSALRIDKELARTAFSSVAERLGLDIEATVSGVLDLFTEMTVDALKMVSVKRGHDPRDFSLVVFGGGGPLHGVRLGQELGVREVLIPPRPSTFSAWGMLQTEPRVDLVRTAVLDFASTPKSHRDGVFADLQTEARNRLLAQGTAETDLREPQFALDMRYVGQEHTVRVRLGQDKQDDGEIVASFHSNHHKLYTFALEDTPIEIVNFRLRQSANLHSTASHQDLMSANTETPGSTERAVSLDWNHGNEPVRVFSRAALAEGFSGAGPALVDENASTTVIPSGHRFHVDAHGNLVVLCNV